MNIKQLYEIFQKHPIVSTDSRNCPPGSIFFALKGEQFNGNDYIGQVLESGAAYAVGDDENLPENERIIRVDNVLQTLQQLANYHRNQMPGKILSVTGTNGKTTTKELIATVLSSKYNVLYTRGNLNNHIGVPLTLLRLTKEHEFGIIEMGANHIGEIHELCLIAEPDFGLITNVGKAHLEGFGSFDGVIRTKTEMYRFLQSKNGIVFVNKENAILQKHSENLSSVYYGTASEAFVSGEIINSSPYLSLKWKNNKEENKLETRLVGSYNLENILASICIGKYFDVENEKINRALEEYIPSNNRSQNRKTEKNDLILDAYNANPSSMSAALENFNSLQVHPKMLILGEMKELGKYSKEEHRKILTQLAEYKIDEAFFVGESFNERDLFLPEWKFFPTTNELRDYLLQTPIQDFHILIKGSRGNRLEDVVACL